MGKSLRCSQPLLGRVYHDLLDEVNKKRISFGKHLIPLSFLDFGKLVIRKIVLWIHVDNLSFGWSSHYFYDLDQMINTALANK